MVNAAAEQSRSPENALVFRLLAATGCRRAEVVALRWGDVDFDPDTASLLWAQWTAAADIGLAGGVPPKPEHYVFQRQPGSNEPMPPARISQAWRRLCREAGVNARLHDVRHLQASLLLESAPGMRWP